VQAYVDLKARLRALARPQRRPTGWHLMVPVIFIMAGVLFATSAATAKGTDLRSDGRSNLADLIRRQQRSLELQSRDLTALQERVHALTEAEGARDGRVAEANAEVDKLLGPAGLQEVTGPGVSVTLDDAPRLPDGTSPAGVPPDYLVVHQQDVQAVVNALWAGGAEAIKLMDQRIISTSAVRCVGNTLILQGVVYSPPFTVTAIGDPDALKEALNASPAVSVYKEYVDAYHLGYSVKTHPEVTIPAYTGALALQHANVPQK
jgi:uncharacterized protein YlxW (UPF0749 family)